MSGNHYQSRKNPSVVWWHFTIIDKKRFLASCDYCKRQLSYKTTTTNLKRHVVKMHPNVVVDKSRRTSDKNIEMVNMQNFDVDNSPTDIFATMDDSNDMSTSSEEEPLVKRDILKNKPKPKLLHDTTKDPFIKKETNSIESIKASMQQESYQAKRNYSSKCPQFFNTTDECDAYGKTLSLQLHKLNNDQRFIAERLISEVVFCGRFGSLSKETQLSHAKTSQTFVTAPDQTKSQKQQVSFKYNGETIFVQTLNEGSANTDNAIINSDENAPKTKHSSMTNEI